MQVAVHMRRWRVCVGAAMLLAGCGSGDGSLEGTWPQFRGPGGLGVVAAGAWPRTWDAKTGENIAWTCDLAGAGRSSPIVWRDALFVTSADRNANRLSITRVDRADGSVVWTTDLAPDFSGWTDAERRAFQARDLDLTGWAAPTPVTDGERVYATFGTADVVCVDFDGGVVWRRNFGPPRSKYGLASSLIMHGGVVIWQCDQGDAAADGLSALYGLDAESGATVWRTERPVENGWTTPILVEVNGRPELITTATDWVIAYDPKTGAEHWRAAGTMGEVAPSPVAADGVVYVVNEGSAVVAIRAGGRGDVSRSHVLWRANTTTAHTASPVCRGRFFLEAGYRLLCHNTEDGTVLWTKEIDGWLTASPTLVGDLVYLPATTGTTYIFRLGERWELVSTGEVAEPIEATPAFVDGRIYLRGEETLFCIAD